MSTKYLGTKNLLFSIINQAETESSDYAIAYYLLQHFGDIRDIQIQDMSQACFVDRSTIRRFFVKYGYDNFLDFKRHYFDQFEEEEDVTSLLAGDYNSYIDALNGKICQMMDLYALRRDKTDDIDNVLQRLRAAERIVVMGDESMYGNLYTIQRRFLAMGKVVFIITNKIADNAVLNSLTKKDAILIISLMGNYLRLIGPVVATLPCRRMLLTMCRQPPFADIFDHIAWLTRDPDKVDEDIWRRYGLTYYIDIMLSTYRMKYLLS